jgi:two-component system, OmpR family, response regulator
MADPTGPSLSVLIADDDSLVRMVLRMVMQKLGHQVVEASSAEEFAAAITTGTFGLCIMDASMPHSSIESRLDLFESLAPRTPLIVMSGYSEPPAAVKARGIDFMSKPIDLQSLTSAVAAIDMLAVQVDPA